MLAHVLKFSLLAIALAPAPAWAQGGKGPPPAPVVVVEATRQLLAPVTWYPATIISRNQARLAAEVEGRLESVAEVGTQIEAGEVIARLDATLLKQTLAEHLAAIAREKARLTFLDAEVKRLQKLVKQRTATRSQFDQAVAERGVTRSELAAARARVALTKERINRSVLRAPFGGIVAERILQAGEWAESGESVVKLVDTTSVEVQAWVPVAALSFVRTGTELELKANPLNTSGTVRTLVPVGDDRSRLYELRLRIDEGEFPVGQSLRVAIPTAPAKEVVAVPRDALVLRRQGAAVFRIVGENTAERVAVETGIASGPLIAVTGIESGDWVVIRGGERLRAGQKVSIVKRAGKP